MVDDVDSPIANAVVRVGDAEYATAGDGRGACDLTEDVADATATCDMHEPWSGVIAIGADNRIVLPRSESATVIVVDADDGGPVAGARVWLATEWCALDRLRDGVVPHAVTGVDGKAHFRGLVPGSYRVHAVHADLVYSHEAQVRDADRQWQIMCRVPNGSVTIGLSHPYVVAYEQSVAVERLLKVVGSGTRMHKPRNRDGRDRLAELVQGLAERFPGAAFSLWVRDHHAPGAPLPDGVESGTGRHAWRVWFQTIGREEMEVPVPAVRLDQFRAPVRIDMMAAPSSSAFGSLLVHLRDRSASELNGIVFHLESRHRSIWVMRRLVNGELVTVPAGEYALRCDSEFVDRLCQKMGWFSVGTGEHKEIEVGPGLEWLRVTFSVIDAPDRLGTADFRHRDCGNVVALGFDARKGVGILVPAGEVEATLILPSDTPDMLWRGRMVTKVNADNPGPFAVRMVETRRSEVEEDSKK